MIRWFVLVCAMSAAVLALAVSFRGDRNAESEVEPQQTREIAAKVRGLKVYLERERQNRKQAAAQGLSDGQKQTVASAQRLLKIDIKIDEVQKTKKSGISEKINRQIENYQKKLEKDLREEVREVKERVSLAREKLTQEQRKVETLPQMEEDYSIKQEQKEEIEKLKLEFIAKRKLLDELQSRPDPQKAAAIDVSCGSGQGLHPYYVECKANEIVIYPERTTVSKSNVNGSREVTELANRILGTSNGTVIFLIRSGGVGIFNQVRKSLSKQGIRHGYLPLPGEGDLILDGGN